MHPVGMFELVIGMLVGIVALHWLADRMNWPPSIALLIGGGALAFVPGAPTFHLDPDLVLVLFLRPCSWTARGSPTSRAFGGTWPASCRWLSARSYSPRWWSRR